MFEVVDAERGRLTKSDGAEMPGDGQAAFVGGGDRGLQLRCAKRRIRLERRRTPIGVLGDLFRAALRVGYRRRRLQIRAGQVNLRARLLPRVDLVLDPRMSCESERRISAGGCD